MKRIYFLLLACLLLMSLAAPTHAATWHWDFVGWYGGGCYPNIAFDPKVPNRVYLTSDVAGIWRSDDMGEHWYFITKGLNDLTVSQVAVAPSNSNILYAATNGGVYVSANAGSSWSLTNSTGYFVRPDNYRPIAISAGNANKLCVGTAEGQVFCSTDGGKNWEDKDPKRQYFPTTQPISVVTYDSTDTLFVASADGLKRCTTTCSSLSGAPSKITDLVFSKKSPKTLYAAGDTAVWVSKDSGNSWSKTWGIPSGTTYRVAVDESKTVPVLRVLWINGWNGGALMSTDGGFTWVAQDNLIPDPVLDPSRVWTLNGGNSTAIALNPFNPNILFRTDWGRVWRSDDGGLTWKVKINGAPNTVVTKVFIAPNWDIYVSTMDNGLMRSHDWGKTYQAIFPTSYSDETAGHVWNALALWDGTVIATSSPWNRNKNQIALSRDNGKTFKLASEKFADKRPTQSTMWGEGYPRALASDPNNPNTVYMGIDGSDGGGLYVSYNKGETWQQTPGQPSSLQIYKGLAVDPTNSNRIIWSACGNNGGVYISEDRGRTFTHKLTEMQCVFDVAVAADGVIYAAGDSGGAKLFVSKDHGNSWRMVGDFGAGQALDAIAIDASNPRHMAVGTVIWASKAPGKIFMTKDGANTWEEITGDLPNGAGISSLAFDPQGQYLYAGRYAGSVYRLMDQY